MNRFPANEIISLVGAAPRYDLAESVGPDVALASGVPTASTRIIIMRASAPAPTPRTSMVRIRASPCCDGPAARGVHIQ